MGMVITNIESMTKEPMTMTIGETTVEADSSISWTMQFDGTLSLSHTERKFTAQEALDLIQKLKPKKASVSQDLFLDLKALLKPTYEELEEALDLLAKSECFYNRQSNTYEFFDYTINHTPEEIKAKIIAKAREHLKWGNAFEKVSEAND